MDGSKIMQLFRNQPIEPLQLAEARRVKKAPPCGRTSVVKAS
jgi:hypothetical protein